MLDEIRDCKTEQRFNSALEQFPQTLDETYSRILRRIRPEDKQQAYRALLWIAHSKRPLRLDEFAEAIVVDPSEDRLIESCTGYSAAHNMLEILGSLVVTRRRGLPEQTGTLLDPAFADPRSDESVERAVPDYVHEVFLSHYSVKEYLTSKRRLGDAMEQFRISHLGANRFITCASLRYIFHYETISKRSTADDLVQFPLLRYACTH